MMSEQQEHTESPRSFRCVTSRSPFVEELLQALGMEDMEGITSLALKVEPDMLVRVEIEQLLSQDKAEALLDSLRCRHYALIEILQDEPLAPAADPEPIAA